MPRLVQRVVRARYVGLAVVAGLIWLAAYQGDDDADWHFFVDGAQGLTGSSGLHVYAHMPYLQFGPVALLVGLVFHDVGPNHGWALVSALDMALGLVAIRFLERAAVACRIGADRAALIVTVGGAFVLAAWASPGVREGHPDDVLALLAVSGALWALAEGRGVAAAVLIGLAGAAKPWALLCLPLAAAQEGRRLRGLVVGIAAAVVPWLPFLAAAPSTTRVGQFHISVATTSTLHYLGAGVGSHPSWPRYVQFAVAFALGAVAVRRGRWYLVPVLAFATRITFDAGAADYYAAGAVVGAFVWDLVAPARVPAIRTVLVWFALLYVVDDVGAVGVPDAAHRVIIVVMRLAVLAAALVAIAQRRARYPDPHVTCGRRVTTRM